MSLTVAAIVIAKNESEMIANCLESLRFCDEVIVVDHQSDDTTADLAQRAGARVVKADGSFANVRNFGLSRCKSDWILYIDADERVVPALAQEIKTVIHNPQHAAYALQRSNILYGHTFKHGGWQNDVIVRLFNREKLLKWEGEIHEHAVVDGSIGQLDTQLLHLTHRSVTQGLKKTTEWTAIEAQLLFASGVPPVTLLTLLRKGVMEVIRRAIINGGYKDGLVGWVEALTQGINRILVYMQVWELQQKPNIADRYHTFESKVHELWKRQQ